MALISFVEEKPDEAVFNEADLSLSDLDFRKSMIKDNQVNPRACLKLSYLLYKQLPAE